MYYFGNNFSYGTETKREVWLLRTGFGTAPVNKLVSRTLLLWALRKFSEFYITLLLRPISDRPHFSCIHYKIASLTYNTLQTSQPSYIHQILTIQPPGSTRSSSYLSLSRPPVSFSLKFCNVPLSTLHQFFGTNSQKTSVSLHILITHLLISPILPS